MTDEERERLRAIRDAAYDLAYCLRSRALVHPPADLEAAWQRLLALRWQSMDSAPRDGTWVLVWGPEYQHGIAKCFPVPDLQPTGFDPAITAWMPLPLVKEVV